MNTAALLDAAALAFAIVSHADGRLARAEARGFADFVRGDSAFSDVTDEDVDIAWAAASDDVTEAPDFSEPLAEIAAIARAPQDRETIMRAAQAALVADGVDREQEEGALAAIAEALGLDPAAY